MLKIYTFRHIQEKETKKIIYVLTEAKGCDTL
jgi:hypothetical protein